MISTDNTFFQFSFRGADSSAVELHVNIVAHSNDVFKLLIFVSDDSLEAIQYSHSTLCTEFYKDWWSFKASKSQIKLINGTEPQNTLVQTISVHITLLSVSLYFII